LTSYGAAAKIRTAAEEYRMLRSVKAFVKSVPVIGPSLAHLRGDSFNSADFWDQRYWAGGNSGAGSYNRLAEFKADFLNGFVEQNHVTSVIEYGSGDGAQLKLARYPSYTGIDVSAKAVEMCRTIFANDTSKRFLQSDALATGTTADLSLSLDVIYHLVEDAVFDAYIRQLFESAERFVIVYSSNMDQDWPAKHVRHRQFTRWVEQNKPEWRLQSAVKNTYPHDPTDPELTSFADFYVFAPR
jgi:Methyltransferase domain